VNAVAPNPVTNAEFTATLARVLRRPAVLHVPAFAPKLALGEFADEMLFSSMRIRPSRLLETGYRFRFPDLEPALRHTLGRPGHG
jgi:NAD dependent epimerase/dehydratase family enzyme